MSTQELVGRLTDDGIEHLWLIYHDYSGRSCAKTVPSERFEKAVERGVVFTRANLNFTLEDHQAHGARFLADAGDFLAVPDPDSYAVLPYHERTARAHVFMRADDQGAPWEGCPRTALQSMLATYADAGLSVQVAFEPEFTLFRKTEDGDYAAADHYGMFTVAGLEAHYDLWQQIIETLQEMGVVVEQHGKEYGAGQYEMSTYHATPLKAVDDYLTLKEVVSALAREAGWIATFMPKPFSHLAGNGLHIHLSVWDAEGQNDLTKGEADDEPLSELGYHFVGGLLEHAHALTGLGAPLVNSYKRLLPGSWAPAHVCWGVGNRAALIRVPGLGRRRHLEFRSGDNAANPYIFLTAILAAGLDGIRSEIPAPDPITDDVGHLSDEEAAARGLERLPTSLPQAFAALERDRVIADALGSIILPEFLKVKRTELHEYNHHVHPWERRMYMESI